LEQGPPLVRKTDIAALRVLVDARQSRVAWRLQSLKEALTMRRFPIIVWGLLLGIAIVGLVWLVL